MERMATDIECCVRCGHLIFPGEPVAVLGQDYSHAEHSDGNSPILASVA